MSTAVTLREREEWLDALLNTLDMAESDEERGEILADITDAVEAAVEKRDRVFRFLQHCDQKVEAAKREAKRIQALAEEYEKVGKRVADSVARTIVSLGKDEKGKFRRLEGSLCVLSVAKNPDSVEITDVDAIPDQFKTVSFSLSAVAWEELMAELDMDARAKLLAAIQKPDVWINKISLRTALKAGDVPGAKFADAEYRLTVK